MALHSIDPTYVCMYVRMYVCMYVCTRDQKDYIRSGSDLRLEQEICRNESDGGCEREIGASFGAAKLPGSGIVGSSGVFCSIERAQPMAAPPNPIPNLCRPPAPRPLPHATELHPTTARTRYGACRSRRSRSRSHRRRRSDAIFAIRAAIISRYLP